jgi:hypothetical protein
MDNASLRIIIHLFLNLLCFNRFVSIVIINTFGIFFVLQRIVDRRIREGQKSKARYEDYYSPCTAQIRPLFRHLDLSSPVLSSLLSLAMSRILLNYVLDRNTEEFLKSNITVTESILSHEGKKTNSSGNEPVPTKVPPIHTPEVL